MKLWAFQEDSWPSIRFLLFSSVFLVSLPFDRNPSESGDQETKLRANHSVPMLPRERNRLIRGLSLGFLLLLLLLLSCPSGTQASIHEYFNGAFTPRNNSFFFHGGSEGLYAAASGGNRTSFIRSAISPFLVLDLAAFR